MYHDAARQQISAGKESIAETLTKQVSAAQERISEGKNELVRTKSYREVLSDLAKHSSSNASYEKRSVSPKLTTFQTLRSILRSEGFGSLYAPLPPTLLMAVPQNVVYFVTYEGVRDYLSGNKSSNFVDGKKCNIQPVGWFTPMAAGALARTVAVLVSAPFEVVRTQLGAKDAQPFVSLVKNVYKEGGLRGFFSGLVPTMFRDVPFSASYWFFMESMRGSEMLWGKNCLSRNFFGLKTSDVYSQFGMGVVSGTLATLLTHPFDVVKTQKQVTMDNFPKMLTQGVHETSSVDVSSTNNRLKTGSFPEMLVRSFRDGSAFAGIVPRLLRVAPACGIMISSYEWAKARW